MTRITYGDLTPDFQFKYLTNKMNFSKDAKIDAICDHPWTSLNIDGQGRCFVCGCSEWLPISVGNILEFDKLEDITNSPKAREIQSSILDKSYRYCALNICSFPSRQKHANNIVPKPKPYLLEISVDRSCNLTCPSCRNEFIYIKSGLEFDKRRLILNKLSALINRYQHPLKICLFGDGDPFASELYSEFVSGLRFLNPKTEVMIRTNGLLMKNKWHIIEGLEDNINNFQISIDAFSKDVYERVRQGGNFDRLLDNLDWLRDSKPDINVSFQYVVQAANLDDMLLARQFMDRYPSWRVNFTKVLDWNTWENFEEHAVWKPGHPRYGDYLSHVRQVGNYNSQWIRSLNAISE